MWLGKRIDWKLILLFLSILRIVMDNTDRKDEKEFRVSICRKRLVSYVCVTEEFEIGGCFSS